MATKFHRFTISITKDLKSRMDDVQGPNWSAVARAAFERELAEIARRRDGEVEDVVLARMRASLAKHVQESYSKGWEAGKQWAERAAEWPELERLERFLEDADAEMFEKPTALNVLEQKLFNGIFGSNENDDLEEDARSFWVNRSNDANPTAEFMRGFCEGTTALFSRVRGVLQV